MSKYGFHKGLKANLPSTGLVDGHYYQCTDTGELFLATSATTLVPVGKNLAEYRRALEQDVIDAGKQAKLASGQNIKTINGESLLGAGNITVAADVKMSVTTLTSNPSNITLDSSAARTYQNCTISSSTIITLSGGNANPGYEHYILFHNTGSSDCVITPSSIMVAPLTITVKAGKYLEMSWIYNGASVIITNSTEIG